MGIRAATIYDWIKRFPQISDALKKGKAPVDAEVENALLKRALGYEYEEVTTEVEEFPTGKTDEDGNPIKIVRTRTKRTTKMVIPDTTAQIFWLKNRRPDRWRDKPVTAEDTTTLEKLDAMLAEVRGHAANA